jgi:hypothetical protein
MSSEATAAKMFADPDAGPEGWRRNDIRAALDLLMKVHEQAEQSGVEELAEGFWYLLETIAALAGEQLEEDAPASKEAIHFVSHTYQPRHPHDPARR